MKKIFLSFVVAIYSIAASAQDDVIPVGDVKKVTVQDSQLDLATTHAFVRIQVYSSNVIRVRMSGQPFGDDFSYAVVARPGAADPSSAEPGTANGPAAKPANPTTTSPKTAGQKIASTLTQPDQTILFHTDSLKVRITKRPFSISFYTPDDRPINEDEPGLGTSWIGTEVTSYRHLQEGERFIGLGEKTGPLDRKGKAYTNWNSDVFSYPVTQDPLYSTIPFYIGIHHGLQYGIFFDNSYQSDFNFGASNNRFSSFSARGGEMNYYFIYHSSVKDIITSYTWLTGRMKMPPLWSLGYQQNRYSYYPDTEVYRIAHTLREKKIPADGITLDIHYMDHYKLFTWDKERFPDPKRMIDSLGKMGFKVTLIVDPGIKVEKGYPAYESGLQQNIFLKYPDGKPYTAEVWPGWCHFPDFTSQKGRSWWKEQVKAYTQINVAGIWNDMNEIATWGQKTPGNILFDYDGHPTTHLKGHNVFGLQMARSSYEGARDALQKRPFILSRAGYAGLQRYAALWTGDNRAEDDHMLAGVRLLSSLGLSGIAFSAMDVGGFTGNATTGLYTRWMQLGAFIPYFRNHTQFNTKSAEPWAFGEEALDISRNYINLRYKLLPYLYSIFHEATLTGMPVVRSLAIGYTHDEHIYDPAFENQFLFGPAFLVMPQESNQSFSKVYFPAGQWYDLYTDSVEAGGKAKLIELSMATLPIYVKAGSIIPMQSLVQSTGEQPTDTLTLHIYKGPDNSFDYYEDDGETYQYENGVYYQRRIRLDAAAGTITLDAPTGSAKSKFHHIRLALHGFGDTHLQLNGRQVKGDNESTSFWQGALPSGPIDRAKLSTLVLDNSPEKIVINTQAYY